jgi:cell division control protein 6
MRYYFNAMGLFDDSLRAGESIFTNIIALDFDYQPKLVPYRENETKHIATCIKPLFQQRSGRNLFIYGNPGIGKTVAAKHVLLELEEQTDDVEPIYVNCWQHNTTFKVFLEICNVIGYKFTQNKRSDELFTILKQMLNKKSAVFVFDEVDKVDEYDFLYNLLEGIYRKTAVIITNTKDWLAQLDDRIRSRLMAEQLEFRPYNYEETKGILKQRIDYAFARNTWEKEAVELAAQKTFELQDIRRGLFLLKEAGSAAEEKASKKVTKFHVEEALKRLDDFFIKKSTDLEEESRFILSVVKKNSGKKIGDIYRAYQAAGGKAVYKTFQRRIASLEKNRFITVAKVSGGAEGKTSIINYAGKEEKKLTEF